MIDEKVKIKCSKCSQIFRERAHRVRDGLQTNCTHCNRLITFDNGSEDINIRKALMRAREARLALEAERKTASLAQATQATVADRSQY